MLKINKLLNHKKMGKELKCILLSKISQSKDCILYDSNYVTIWKRENYGDSKMISSCQELERREG